MTSENDLQWGHPRMTGAVGKLASELLYDCEDHVAEATKKWLRANQRRVDWLDLYPDDGSPSQKAAYHRVEQEIRTELLTLEADLAERFAQLHRARADIEIPACPQCWVAEGKRVLMQHARDYRYDRTDDSYTCPDCGDDRHTSNV